MQSQDLAIFHDMPFYFWVKDEEGRYLWANRALMDMARQDLIGKTDHELPWAENAAGLSVADKQVLETGKPHFLHEYVNKSHQGKLTLNVCKFLGEFEAKRCVFGVSFVIE